MHKNSEKLIRRESELKRLNDFLSNSKGGSILIAGDRGSGKTTLVNLAITKFRENQKPKFLRRLFLDNQIVLYIPLIIQSFDPNNKSKQEELPYRRLLLRTIARSMESELLTRRYSKLDLPMRWFRSIGYMQSVRKLKPLVNSTNLVRELSSKGSLKSLGSISYNWQQNIDISDAVIEMKLRGIFTTYSKSNSIIIVIDELDKLEDMGFKPESIALLLKNLFNDTGVHVIFISNEPTINRVQQRIKQEPFCAEHTLFRDIILLNHLHPSEMVKLINKEIHNLPEEDNKRQAIASMSLISQLMPYNISLLRQKLGIDGENILSKLQNELGDYRYFYESTMHLFINHLYEKHSKNYDQYHNRILYKALTEASNNLFNREIRYINWEAIDSIFYTSNIFIDSHDELIVKDKGEYEGQIEDWPDICIQLQTLNDHEQKHILNAVEELVAVLDRAGYLDMEFDLEYPMMLKFKSFMGDAFTIANIKDNIDEYLIPTSEEKKIVDRLNAIDVLYKILIGHSIFKDLLYIPVDEATSYNEKIQTLDGKNYHRTIRSAWKVIEARLAETDGKLMEGVARTIRERFRTRGYYYSSDPIISIDAKSLSVKIAFSSKNYIVHLAYQSCNLNIPDDYEKLFVLYTGSQAPFKDNNPRKTRRQINCHRNWANLESEIDSIVSYIDKNQPQS
jgi:KAP family P-loop domain